MKRPQIPLAGLVLFLALLVLAIAAFAQDTGALPNQGTDAVAADSSNRGDTAFFSSGSGLSAVFSVLEDFLPKSIPLGRYGVRLFKNGAEVPYAYIDADGRTVLSSSAGRLSIEVKRGSSGGITPSGLEVPESVVLEPGQSQTIVLPDKAELELSDGALFELSEQVPAVIVKRPECVQNISGKECLPAESPIRQEQGVNSTQLIAALSSI